MWKSNLSVHPGRRDATGHRISSSLKTEGQVSARKWSTPTQVAGVGVGRVCGRVVLLNTNGLGGMYEQLNQTHARSNTKICSPLQILTDGLYLILHIFLQAEGEEKLNIKAEDDRRLNVSVFNHTDIHLRPVYAWKCILCTYSSQY